MLKQGATTAQGFIVWVWCDTNNCSCFRLQHTTDPPASLEFSENISKVGTQPIIGTQINFKFEDTIGLLPLISLNEDGYKRIVELSSKSYLDNDTGTEPHCDISELYKNNNGVLILSGSIQGLFGKLFDKGRFAEIHNIYKKISYNFVDRFYLEIQRHGDLNEKIFEKYNLQKSSELKMTILQHVCNEV